MSRGFRVWDKQTENYDWDREFVLNSSGELMELRSNHDGTWEYRFVDTDRFIIEFNTGLKDKNGKKIHEGDIVEYDWYIIGSKPAYRVKEQVMFNDMGARVGNDRIRLCSNVEVIGNIHENPELLGGKND